MFSGLRSLLGQEPPDYKRSCLCFQHHLLESLSHVWRFKFCFALLSIGTIFSAGLPTEFYRICVIDLIPLGISLCLCFLEDCLSGKEIDSQSSCHNDGPVRWSGRSSEWKSCSSSSSSGSPTQHATQPATSRHAPTTSGRRW